MATKITHWWDIAQADMFVPSGGFHDDELFTEWAKCALSSQALREQKTLHHAKFHGWTTEEQEKKILKQVDELKGHFVETVHYKKNKKRVANVYAWPESVLDLGIRNDSDKFYVIVMSLDKRFIRKCEKIFKVLKPELEIHESSVYVLGTEEGQLKPVNIGTGGYELERGNYTKKVLEGYDLIKKDLVSATPSGRLGIFEGPPGTGKTYLIRGLIKDVSALFVIIPAQIIPNLTDPSLMSTLLKTRLDITEDETGYPIVLLVEDADMALLPRMGDNIGAISNMLNASSGIMGDLIDIRIIATTNAKRQEIEAALLRSGRLSSRVEVKALSLDHANEIYRRLTSGDYIFSHLHTPLADVYAQARKDGWTPPVVNKKN